MKSIEQYKLIIFDADGTLRRCTIPDRHFPNKEEELNDYFTIDDNGVLHCFSYDDEEFNTLKPYIFQLTGVYS